MVGFDQPILLQHYDKLETDHSTGTQTTTLSDC